MGFSLGGAIGGGLLGGTMGATIGGLKDSLFGMKQYDAQSTNSSFRNPYGALQPQLDYSLGQARSIYDQGVNPWITQANQMQANRALDPNSLTSQAQGVVGNTIAGNYLSPDSNPYLQQSVNDALGLTRSQLNSQYGGPAGQNVDNSGFQENMARTLGQVATNAYGNAYQQERQNQMAALSMAPTLDYSNIGALYNAGVQQQQAPWGNLAAYQAAFSPALSFGTAGGTSTQPLFENRTAETLGALLGGGALAAGFMGGKPPTGGGGYPSFGGFGPSAMMG